MNTLIPIILSGDAGTRLWLLSREKHPKQLLSLINENSLLQATARRLDGLEGVKVKTPIIVCNEEYRFVIAEQLRLMDRKGTILLEPIGRNTAPALTLAALAAPTADKDPVLLVMSSDHIIMDITTFQATVLKGMSLALAGHIITFGITLDTPSLFQYEMSLKGQHISTKE